jgi:phenylacetate-coenzyme A ligase PaaK-like adenylate-forming protein
LAHVEQIPFLPIDFFKSHDITCFKSDPQKIFTSSGTTGKQTSQHLVHDLAYYHKSLDKSFELFYGQPDEYVVLALLPHYLERTGSSLVDMAARWINQSKNEQSGFYLDEMEQLKTVLISLGKSGTKTILLGVTFALLDLAANFDLDFPELIIIETGGMKGMRREMIREEVHAQIGMSFRESEIHSEYGMTELLSQAYRTQKRSFQTPPWMQVNLRDVNDPLSQTLNLRSGGINVIDLANQTSCAFIATQDLGRNTNKGFEVLGRFDQSQVRGCNLLVTQS